jgi:hypothetical protein
MTKLVNATSNKKYLDDTAILVVDPQFLPLLELFMLSVIQKPPKEKEDEF